MGNVKLFWVALAGMLALAACGDNPTPAQKNMVMQTSASAPTARMAGAAAQQQQRRIAMSHNFTLRFPLAEVEKAQKQHVEACLKLDCSVLNSSFSAFSGQNVSGSLSVRVSPDAFDPFVKALLAPPAHIVSHSETAEDKTIAIIDVEARLNSKKALRDELLAMKKQSTKASLSDLLSIERELTNVQAEIESDTAQFNYLKTLTDTIKIDVSYQNEVLPEQFSEFAPVAEALHRVKRTFATSVATLISFLATATPWLPVLAALIWGLRWLFRRWRRKAG